MQRSLRTTGLYNCRRPLVGHPFRIRHKQDWGPPVYPFITPGYCKLLLGSDAGSDCVMPTSGFVIQNQQTWCSMWCPIYKAGCTTWSAVCFLAPHSQLGEEARPHSYMDECNRPTPVPTTPKNMRLRLSILTSQLWLKLKQLMQSLVSCLGLDFATPKSRLGLATLKSCLGIEASCLESTSVQIQSKIKL